MADPFKDQTDISKDIFRGGLDYLRSHLKTIPNRPGIYQMIDEKGKVLNVGKAIDLKKRVTSYTRIEALPLRLKRMVFAIRDVHIIVTQNEVEALLLESNLIKKLRPTYNILLKDDKSYSYILIKNNHGFPRLQKYRGKRKDDGHYFGPFASSEAIDETFISLQKLFKLRTCKDTEFAEDKFL